MVGLADCNNFFVSCERRMNPELEGKPVVVLSNNDGCAIARSNEAKALGIRMGQPAFELRELIRNKGLIALSGNHVLYHDISVRIHKLFSRFVPATIDYSVDEAFLNVEGIPLNALPAIGNAIRTAAWNEEKIPVTIGFGPTKTLAKTATGIGKKINKRVHIISREDDILHTLKQIRLGDLWGIGRRNVKKLYLEGIHTAFDFYNADRTHIRKLMGVTGEQTWLELHSVPCIELKHVARELQDSVSESRTFPVDVRDIEYIKSRISIYTADCGRRLRKMQGKCNTVAVYLATNRFHTERGAASPYLQTTLRCPTSDSRILTQVAVELLMHIYDSRYHYKRAGVILGDIVPAASCQPSLFDEPGAQQDADNLINVIDNINNSALNPIIKLASHITKGAPGHNDGYSSTFQFRN